MKKTQFAAFGAGFWANYQIPGWQELDNVECVAIYNRTREKAEQVARKFGIPRVYDDPEELLAQEKDLDFIDVLTDVDTHLKFTRMGAEKGLHVVCQKPMAPSFEDARQLVKVCQEHQVNLFINENFRWQLPLRRCKEVLDSGQIGKSFKLSVSFCSAFPVFENQPFLAELDQFILTDVGSHILDVCRFLGGEARNLHCKIQRVNPGINGEDVANVFMEMQNGVHCYAEMSYASILEKEFFPQTLVLIEGEKGSIKLEGDFVLKVTTREGTKTEKISPQMYPWIDPDYAVVHSSIVDAQRNILSGIRGGQAETTGEDNFKTVQLVYDSYKSAASGEIIRY
ncbi:MAG: Gfo/Idh/MocA family protein [Candidatus Cyclobacteriaceae bacterium M3_2C_046]